jgi:hypothetical protein
LFCSEDIVLLSSALIARAATLRPKGWDRSCSDEGFGTRGVAGAALTYTLPGVEDRLLAAGTYATGDPALHQERVRTGKM